MSGSLTALLQRPCTETASTPQRPLDVRPPPEAGALGPATSQGDPAHTPGKRHTAGNTHPVTSCSV